MTSPFGADGGNLLHLISSKLPYLPSKLRVVAELILKDPEAAQTLTIMDLAARCGVAESTVSRFAREIGLDGYASLRMGVAEALFMTRSEKGKLDQQFVYEGISRDDDLTVIVGKIERSSQRALRQTGLRINVDALELAVGLIETATSIVFCCMGSSAIAAEDGVMRFTRAGKKCLLFRDQSIQIMLATIVTPEDVLIAISDSGQSTSIVEALRIGRQHGASTIGITSDESAPLVEHCDVALFTAAGPSGGGVYGESVTSKWGQLLVVDCLYAGFAARHFDDTLAHLEATYSEAIRHSRRPAQRPTGRPTRARRR